MQRKLYSYYSRRGASNDMLDDFKKSIWHLTLGQGQPLTWVSMSYNDRCVWMRQSILCLHLNLIESYWQKKTFTNPRWQQMIFLRDQWQKIEPCSPRLASVLWSSLNHTGSNECHGNKKHFDILLVTYSEKITKMPWPKVTNIQYLIHARCRHRWFRSNLLVSSHFVAHMDFDRMTSLPKTWSNAIWGEITLCDLVTWP